MPPGKEEDYVCASHTRCCCAAGPAARALAPTGPGSVDRGRSVGPRPLHPWHSGRVHLVACPMPYRYVSNGAALYFRPARSGGSRLLAGLLRSVHRRDGHPLCCRVHCSRTPHLLAQVRRSHGAARLPGPNNLRDGDLRVHHGGARDAAPGMGDADLFPPFPRCCLLWPFSVPLPRRAVRTPLDTLGGACLDSLAVAPVFLPQLVSKPEPVHLAFLDQHSGVAECSEHSDLLSGLPLPAHRELSAAPADQVGGVWHLGSARGIPWNILDAWRLCP